MIKNSFFDMKKIKPIILLTLLSHFFTFFGFAHAGAFVGLIEILWFPYFTHHLTLALSENTDEYLAAVGFFGFIGNMLLIVAILLKKERGRKLFHIVGLISFWISIFYLSHGHMVVFHFVFCLPFAFRTIFPFTRNYVHRLMQRRSN